jgi:hypothetical protein
MKKTLFIPFMVASMLQASCFNAGEDLTENAQNIRLTSKSMGWEVGTVKSLSVATLIKAKQELYPDGSIKVCIKENDGDLKFIMHSSSTETTEAKWHFLTASKTGWF